MQPKKLCNNKIVGGKDKSTLYKYKLKDTHLENNVLLYTYLRPMKNVIKTA